MSRQPFKVKAIFDYTSPEDEDLNFPSGQIITVTEDDEEDWYTGEYVNAEGVKKEGIFPRNFVEKYEPTAPPRPNRAARPKKEAEAPISTSVADTTVHRESPRQQAVESNAEPPAESPIPQASPPAPKPTSPPVTAPVETSPIVAKASPSSPPGGSKPGPPPVTEKPSGGSFKDRIAAFNKSAAPPPAPFKPGGLGGQSFIKKPFVAPPPSKNSYVPIPREAPPQKIYRRDEDPEIAAKETENQENAERAGLVPTANEEDGEDQPKPTSLKERIALLQKQQAEQAARHADAASKKEKPKRPSATKKRADSHNAEIVEDGEGADLERAESHDTIGKRSIDSAGDEPTQRTALPPRRKSSKGPPPLPRDSFTDGNDADMSGAGDETEGHDETSTGRDDSDDKPRSRAPAIPARAPSAPFQEPDVGEEEGAVEEEAPVQEEDDDEEEEDDIDPEIRRKEELRARMAKMSGGMGMHGMFGGGMPMPTALPARKKKAAAPTEARQSGDYSESPVARAPAVPGIPMPGMFRSPDESNRQLETKDEAPQSPNAPSHEDVEAVDFKPTALSRSSTNRSSMGAPPVPGSRPAPPPVPSDSRPVPPPRAPTQPIVSPGPGSESDDELSLHGQGQSLQTPTAELPTRSLPPRPPQGAPAVPSRLEESSPIPKSDSYFGGEAAPTSPTTPGASKRASRLPPPIPGAVPTSPPQNRAPPPLPPLAPSLSRSSTGDAPVLASPTHLEHEESEEEVTEYEGDYDTDIASTASHKEALKSHVRDASMDDLTPVRSPVTSPSGGPPPLPMMGAPRAMPPPLPSQPPPNARRSADMPRAVPPPPPPSKQPTHDEEDDDDYDPYKYIVPRGTAPVPIPTPQHAEEVEQEVENSEDIYSASPPRSKPPMPQERAAPPPPPREAIPPPAPNRAPSKPSMDAQRGAPGSSRRSTDLSRMSLDSGFVANDVDLSQGTLWWAHANGVPPVFQNRKDILFESEDSTVTKRGGKSTTTKDLYVLFQDYSQTVITVHFDPANPADASLEQRHEQPPSRLRQDQLESSHERFGKLIASEVANKNNTIVGDGTPHAVIIELLRSHTDALLPIGTRSYGALVYANLANASTTLNDEIRPGDIMTIRNAKFQGKHGAMHAKYSVDVGMGGQGHVAVVAEWDGTKKKIRAWEQGREKKKVSLESFKLDDLRSGEVKVWRVVERGWVGWEGSN